MSHDDTPSEDPGPRSGRGLPTWKKGLLALAASSVVLGLALGQMEEPSADASGSEDSSMATPAETDSPEYGSAPGPEGRVDPSVPNPETGGVASLEPGLALSPDSDSAMWNALTDFAAPSALVPHGEAPDRARTHAPATDVGLADGDPLVPTASSNGPQSGPTTGPSSRGARPLPWSPLFLKGGLSIFVGFCIGHALRAFFKVTFIALGAVFLVAIGLQYAGLFEIDWEAASGLYDQAVARVGGELDDLRAFVAGSLPSAGLGSLGLFAGFKRSA